MNDFFESNSLSLKRFTKCLEDFYCEACQILVKGNGYTNHCPACLTSKHVDIYPGDRQETCQGRMKARGRFYHKKKGLMIVHQCTKCFAIKKNKISSEDDPKALEQLDLIKI